MPLQRGPIKHYTTYITVVTGAEYKWDFECTKDRPYLALPGELLAVVCVDFAENWQRYNGATLYNLDQTELTKDISWITLVSELGGVSLY